MDRLTKEQRKRIYTNMASSIEIECLFAGELWMLGYRYIK